MQLCWQPHILPWHVYHPWYRRIDRVLTGPDTPLWQMSVSPRNGSCCVLSGQRPTRQRKMLIGCLCCRHRVHRLFGLGDALQFFFTLKTAREWLSLGLLELGEQEHGYSFHSLRRGVCTRAFQRGADATDIKLLGGWRSEAVRLYIPDIDARARAASSLTHEQLPS